MISKLTPFQTFRGYSQCGRKFIWVFESLQYHCLAQMKEGKQTVLEGGDRVNSEGTRMQPLLFSRQMQWFISGNQSSREDFPKSLYKLQRNHDTISQMKNHPQQSGTLRSTSQE